jgi:hypothetical protein
MTPPVGYQQRLVLFLDFLGFRDIIKDSEENPGKISSVVAAIDHIKQVTDEREFYPDQHVTQFSDSLVVSYPILDRSAVLELLIDIGFCVVDLVGRGFLVRGAVTAGPLLHTDSHLFGPAMVRAYEMESEHAKHPRVIVDESIFDIASAAHALHHTPDEERAYVQGLVKKDMDGWPFIEYVSFGSVVATIGGDQDLYPNYLKRVSEMLGIGLRHPRRSVREKYFWLHGWYIAAMDTDLPSGFRAPTAARDNRAVGGVRCERFRR